MKVNGNGEIMLAGILWGTIGIFIWFMKRDGATAEWISFLRVFFRGLSYWSSSAGEAAGPR